MVSTSAMIGKCSPQLMDEVLAVLVIKEFKKNKINVPPVEAGFNHQTVFFYQVSVINWQLRSVIWGDITALADEPGIYLDAKYAAQDFRQPPM